MTLIDSPTELSFSRPTEDTLLIRLAGNWRMGQALPSADDVQRQVDLGSSVQQLSFDTQDLVSWDSGLLKWGMRSLLRW